MDKTAQSVRTKGTLEAPERKVWEISDVKVSKADGKVRLCGYANTKGSPDRYGDIPTVFSAMRSYVYELAHFVKNPVLLIDHNNSVESIAGSFDIIREDEKGLYFEATFSESDHPRVKHARTVYSEGHGKALSIGGMWSWEDPKNPQHLTHADIFEISLVGVGADPNALGAAKSAPAHAPETEQTVAVEVVTPASDEEPSDADVAKLTGELATIKYLLDQPVHSAEVIAELQRLGDMLSQAAKQEA